MTDTKKSDSKHTPGPRCYRKNRGGYCRSPVYTMNAKGEATCFYHARTEEIADVKARAATRSTEADCKHEWDLVEEYGGHFVTRCVHCRVDMLRDMLARAAIARARGDK